MTTYSWTHTLPNTKKKNRVNVLRAYSALPLPAPCLNKNHLMHTNGVETSRNANTTPTVTVKSYFHATAMYIVWKPIRW